MKFRFPARTRTRVILGLGFALIIVAGAVVLRGSGGAQADTDANKKKGPLEFRATDFVEPHSQRLRFDLVVPATLQASTQAVVRSKVSAVVQALTVREGDAVMAGQVLVEFDTAALKSARDERAAALASAQANLVQAERTRDANQQLVRRNFIAQNAFDSADSTYQAQLASVQVAQAQLAQAQLQLDDAVVHAPISGRVARRYVQPGEKVGMDGQLISIVDLGRLEVQGQAPVADAARLAPGTAVDVEVDGLPGRHFRGVLDRINPSADPGSRSIGLYAMISNPGEALRTGMFATLRIELSSATDLLALPEAAVREEAGQRFVWVLQDGHIVRRVVSTGRHDEQSHLIEVVGGVNAGEKVLGGRFDDLRDGAEAKVSAGA